MLARVIFGFVFLFMLDLVCEPNAYAQVDCNMPREQHVKYLKNYYGLDEKDFKPLPGCEGYDNIDPGFANMDIEGTHLRVSRDKWMPFGGDEADGKTRLLKLYFGNHSLAPLSELVVPENIVLVNIFGLKNRESCRYSKCFKPGHVQFVSIYSKLFQVTSFEARDLLSEDFLKLSRLIINSSEPGTGKFQKFNVLKLKGTQAIFRSEFENIVEWFICSEKDNSCESRSLYSGKLDVSLSSKFTGLDELMSLRDLLFVEFLPTIITN